LTLTEVEVLLQLPDLAVLDADIHWLAEVIEETLAKQCGGVLLLDLAGLACLGLTYSLHRLELLLLLEGVERNDRYLKGQLLRVANQSEVDLRILQHPSAP